MTEIADDRSWWTDVEHLRPGGEATRATPRSNSGAVAEHPGPAGDEPTPRRGRITGKQLQEVSAVAKPAVLKRADAAAFADAMDLDGAFGAPAQPSRSREIILSRSTGDASGAPGERPAVRGLGSPDRETVRIAGSRALPTDVADHRPLRDLEPRRQRSTVERMGHRPDRIAMWVVFLGIALVVIAATSSSAGA